MTMNQICLSSTSDEGMTKLENLLNSRDDLLKELSKLYDMIEQMQQAIIDLDHEIDRVILEDKRASQ